MKPKALLRLLFVASMALLIFVAGLLLLPKWRQMELMRQSEPIQEALKTYHQKHRSYPDALDQIGIPSREEGPIYYQREGSSYMLWFGPAWANRGPTVPVKAIGDSATPRMATAFDFPIHCSSEILPCEEGVQTSAACLLRLFGVSFL